MPTIGPRNVSRDWVRRYCRPPHSGKGYQLHTRRDGWSGWIQSPRHVAPSSAPYRGFTEDGIFVLRVAAVAIVVALLLFWLGWA